MAEWQKRIKIIREDRRQAIDEAVQRIYEIALYSNEAERIILMNKLKEDVRILNGEVD